MTKITKTEINEILKALTQGLAEGGKAIKTAVLLNPENGDEPEILIDNRKEEDIN